MALPNNTIALSEAGNWLRQYNNSFADCVRPRCSVNRTAVDSASATQFEEAISMGTGRFGGLMPRTVNAAVHAFVRRVIPPQTTTLAFKSNAIDRAASALLFCAFQPARAKAGFILFEGVASSDVASLRNALTNPGHACCQSSNVASPLAFSNGSTTIRSGEDVFPNAESAGGFTAACRTIAPATSNARAALVAFIRFCLPPP